MPDKCIDPCDRLIGFPVENRDTMMLIITRVVAEELCFGLGVVIAGKMVVTKRDLIRDALLYMYVTLAVDKISAFSGLGHNGTEAAILDDGLDADALLVITYVDKLNHRRHSPWRWRWTHRAMHRRGYRQR